MGAIRLKGPTYILGISAYYHDSAAVLLKDGEIVAAAQEERFTRKKHDPSFPQNAVRTCLREGDLSLADLSLVAFYDKPFLKFERLLETYYAFAPRGLRSFAAAIPVWIREKIFLKKLLREGLEAVDRGRYEGKILFPEHHRSHAASAFYPSPFQEAAVLTVDGVGEYATTTLGHGRGNRLELLKEIQFPHSLGLLYSAFTYHTGFKVNSGEYKLMGLAPYGEPRYEDRIREHIIRVKEDGSFRLNMDYFDYATGLKMTSRAFDRLFEHPRRKPESPLTQHEMDMAASVQRVTEDVLLKMATHAGEHTGARHLVMAGGVALNCVANGKLLRAGIFDDIWIQPAAGDAGGALGAALGAWHEYLGMERTADDRSDRMRGAYLGPAYSDARIADRLSRLGAVGKGYEDAAFFAEAARMLEDGKVVGWFQGRMEFGPRALGARSIIGDARNPEMQRKMNLKIKYRESFRPFAPSVLEERVSEYFDLDRPSPYMLLVADVQAARRILPSDGAKPLFGIERLNVPRSDIPAVTHVDYSARVQSVNRETNPRYWKLIRAFDERTGYGVIVNTSFNVRGEPIVRTPEDAYRCFMRTDMDALAIGNRLYLKADQPKWQDKGNWREEFELD